MPGYAYCKDKQGVYRGCNSLFANAAGIAQITDIVGKTDYDLPWHNLAKSMYKEDKEIYLAGKPQSYEKEFLFADGRKVSVLLNKSPVTDEDGNIVGYIGIAFDITKQKKQEKELQVSRRQAQLALENILDNVPAHIFWKDRNCVLLGCNNLQAKNMGFASGAEMIGKSNYEVIWPHQPEEDKRAQAEAITRTDLQVMNSGQDYVIEEPLVLPNGNTAIYLSRKTPLRNEEGEIIGLLGISFDITALKKAEQELQETRHKLDGSMLVSASIAHEIRTPLATLDSGTRSIQRYLPRFIEAYERAAAANIDVPHIDNQVIHSLKELANGMKRETEAANLFIDMLLMNLHPDLEGNKSEVFSINDTVNNALARYPFKPGQREKINWHGTKDFIIRGKQLLIVHILFNLIKNALFYTANLQKAEIRIWLEQQDTYNQLYFEDTGQGIHKELLPHIFERFFSTTRNGAGIGLTYCKMVMEALGGSITCESEAGRYTRFILNFPLAQ